MSRTRHYPKLTDAQVLEAVAQARATLGKRAVILGHHYQRDAVVRFADYRGDSLDLSRRAAEERDAQYIVFCGVMFMAETAAILCSPEQVVCQPVVEALCPMARMASRRDAAEAWEALAPLGGKLVPITYQNSTAEVKAFVGERGGAVCTSSNARRLFEWAFARGDRILFLPDEHLGTNTAMDMGIPRSEVGRWDPADPPAPESLAGARVVVWKGYCSVHTRMTLADVARARADGPDVRVVVHPECRREVVERSDAAHSTTGIIRFVEEAPPGATVYVGTEINLVNRLAAEHPDKRVVPLRSSHCVTMNMTTPRDLLYVLKGLLKGEPRNVVRVDEETARWARVALERMLTA